jgi:DNA-binding MarR family transcriptional regulator
MIRRSLDDPSIGAWRDQTLYRLLLRASRTETAATLDRLRDCGYVDVSLADANLLANLDTGGTIISALARRAGITRQAAGQQIVGLEKAGYVERRASDTDGRASVIYQTDLGRALLNDALDIVGELESHYAELLGSRQFSSLKRLLTALLNEIDPEGTLGRD